MRTCPSCGHENPADNAFCGACGASLASLAPVRETRKTVTVVFADVTGSTELGERLDPEALRDTMQRWYAEMRAVLERHGGTVEKFAGDAVLAVFGVPVVHEDDALRAVRAAVEMREALGALNARLEGERGVGLEARIGLNTGEVVAGDAASGQSFATGDTVNTAARLEQAARPGEILVGEPTFALVRDAVEVEPVEAVAARGKAEPLRAYRLLDVMADVPGRARRLDSPLVGRHRERRLLYDTFERVLSDRSCQLVTILGPAGVGKSRLVREFLDGLGGQATPIRGRCLSYGEGITWWPLAEAVRGAAGVEADDNDEVAHARVATLVEGDEGVAAMVAGLIGLGEASSPEESFWAVRRFLETLAHQRPLVAVFDDVHWAEQAFLDLVEHLAEWSREAPIMLVCLGRPELLEVRPTWGGGKLNAASLLLEPMTPDEAAELIDNLLGAARLPSEARNRIVEAAEGNPLYVEELLGMMVDEGLLVASPEGWVVQGDLASLAVPPTIQALLAARLDGLPAVEQAVLERAAVEGKVFERSNIAELVPGELRELVGGALASLVRKQLVAPAGSEGSFRFRHILTRDAAYERTAKRTRADLHERYAGLLERDYSRPQEIDEIVGHHLAEAAELRHELAPLDDAATALGERAGERLAAAGMRAFEHGDYKTALPLLDHAAKLLPAGRRARLLLALAEAAASTEEPGRAALVADQAVLEAEAQGDAVGAALARIEAGFYRDQTDPTASFSASAEAARAALPIFEAAHDDAALARAWEAIGDVHWAACQWEAQAGMLERALEFARRAGDRRREWILRVRIANALFWGPTPVGEADRRIRELLEEGGSPAGQASLLTRRGGCAAMEGRFEKARDLVGEARRVSEELGLRVRVGTLAMITGQIEALAGDAQAADRVFREGCEILASIGETASLSTVAGFHAVFLVDEGRLDEAEHAVTLSRETAAEDDIASQVLWRSALARIEARRGRVAEALAVSEEALNLDAGADHAVVSSEALKARAEVLRLAGRSDEAAQFADAAVERLERKGSVVGAERARRLLAAVPEHA